MSARLTRADFEPFAPLPGGVTSEERAALYAMSDAIQDDIRNEREAHAQLDRSINWGAHTGDTWPHCCGSCHQGRRPCPCPHACQVATEDDDTPRPPKQRGDNLRTLALWVLTALAIGATLYASGVRL